MNIPFCKYESNEFQMAKLRWRLEIYPNGNNNDTAGYLIIHLRLLSLPPIIDKIIIVCNNLQTLITMQKFYLNYMICSFFSLVQKVDKSPNIFKVHHHEASSTMN